MRIIYHDLRCDRLELLVALHSWFLFLLLVHHLVVTYGTCWFCDIESWSVSVFCSCVLYSYRISCVELSSKPRDVILLLVTCPSLTVSLVLMASSTPLWCSRADDYAFEFLHQLIKCMYIKLKILCGITRYIPFKSFSESPLIYQYVEWCSLNDTVSSIVTIRTVPD